MYFIAKFRKKTLTLLQKAIYIIQSLSNNYNRNAKEYRMLDGFLPRVRSYLSPFRTTTLSKLQA